MAAAAALWGVERALRFSRFARINALFSKTRQPPVVAGRPYRDSMVDNAYGMGELKRSSDYSYNGPFNEETLPQRPGGNTPGTMTPGLDTPATDFGDRAVLGYYDEGSLQPLGSYDSRQVDPYARENTSTPSTSTFVSQSGGYFPIHANERKGSDITENPYRKEAVAAMPAFAAPRQPPPPIPIGFAQAQLLPSRTVRLTIRVARPFRWRPGQSVLLYLPDLSRIQSHPFTITNNGETEIVLLVKARKGLTRRLFDLVRTRSLANVGLNGAADKRLSLASMRGGDGGVQVPPVYVRAWVDGPMGSATRTKWDEFSSILIICGGSGISFGTSVSEYACRMMAQRSTQSHTQRVRLCWVVREYAEIAWVSGQLRRCQQMVSIGQLQIDIFVTNASKVRDDFAPPRPGFADGGYRRQGSMDSVTSEMSLDLTKDDNETVDTHDGSTHYNDVIDLTNYEDEEDMNDPVENQLSDRLQQQGKVRRAKSRRAARGPTKHTPNSPSYPPHRRQHSILAPYDDEDRDGPHPAPLRVPYNDSRSPQDSVYAPPHTSTPSNNKRNSYHSVADSTYGRYDPFAGGAAGFAGPSPSLSMMFDDNQSTMGESVRNLMSNQLRSGSMVLLEDNSGDPTGDAALWIDESDYIAMSVLSETARAGKPKLSSVLEEEIQLAKGSMMVASESAVFPRIEFSLTPL